MNTTVDAILRYCGGANRISSATGCTIVKSNNSVMLVFRKLAGGCGEKISHLQIAYNRGMDLFDITGYKLDKKTLDLKTVVSKEGIYAETLKETCENMCQLYFTLS